jgi:nucleotide-binding universal stress UspA family protein
MYNRILVCLENSPTDQYIIDHVQELARLCKSTVLLVHVADGWAARNIKQLDLRESEEMREDREYLDRVASGFVAAGVPAEALLATGDPANEVTAAAERERCDLIAMATHGHKFIGDVIHGSVASAVRHKSMVPVLLVRAPGKAAP